MQPPNCHSKMTRISPFIVIISFSIFVLPTTAQLSCADVNDEEVTSVTDLENADFIFAGLFPIKERGCGAYNLEKGVERMEAMIRAIDLINSDTSILNGIKIGYDMRDTCGQDTIGIEAAISLVQSEFGTGNLTNIPIGVIGAASSSVSVPVASFLRVFDIPQVSYASTSALLSDTDRYDYFFRTVASDSFQARAMLDLIRKFKWRYVNAVYTASTYGTPGVEAFASEVVESNDTCLDVESRVPEDEGMLMRLAERLANSDANVVVCFCTSMDANRVLTAVNAYINGNANSTVSNRTHIVWIASDAWATSAAAIDGSQKFADGFFGISPLSQEFTNFTEYFTNISPYNITNDLWFCGFFRQKFNCQYNATNGTRCPNSISSEGTAFVQNNKVPFIYEATYALAYALDSVLKENCRFPYNITLQECENNDSNGMVKVGGEILRDAMYKVNFTGVTGTRVTFDSLGDGPAQYIIHNYVYGETNPFKDVGDWDMSRDERLILINRTSRADNITSFCGGIAPCEVGFRTNFQVGSDRCCWTCEPCTGNTFNPDTFAETCRVCPSGEWGNDPRNSNTRCERIQISFINYNEWWNWLLLAINIAGFVGWVLICVIYIFNWNHTVVKSSGREHCLLMLAGAGIGFVLAFFTVAKPLVFTCIVWSLIYWLSLSLLIFPLLMKIIRIVHIFISKRNIHTLRFTKWHWQIVFSIIPVVIVMSIVIIAFATKPEVIEEFTQASPALEPPLIQLRCMRANSAFDICLYAIFILAVFTLLFSAILTRAYPKNFRASVHIMYASFGLIVLMFVNAIIFFALSGQFQIYGQLVQNSGLILVSYTILLAFFGPRLYYILLGARVTPKENQNTSTFPEENKPMMELNKDQ